MKFCEIYGLTHFDDSPACDPVVYRYGKIVAKDGRIRYEGPGNRSKCRSSNANEAEDQGRLPLTLAIPIVAYHAKCTQQEAKAALRKTHEGEWHHTGVVSRRTNYYSIARAVAYLRFGDAEKVVEDE